VNEKHRVLVAIEVALPPEDAFALFTEEIGEWWSPGKDLGTGGSPRRGRMQLEPRCGGRLLEVYPDDLEQLPFEVGRVLAWKPPHRLVFEWRTGTFQSHERTEVEVGFEGAADKTRVTIEHRGFAELDPGNRVFHGLPDGEFAAMMRASWKELADSYAKLARGAH